MISITSVMQITNLIEEKDINDQDSPCIYKHVVFMYRIQAILLLVKFNGKEPMTWLNYFANEYLYMHRILVKSDRLQELIYE